MSSLKVTQALLTHYKITNSEFGLPSAYENDGYIPIIGTPYARVSIKQNNITSLSLADTNETDGLFRITLCYPLDSGAVAIRTKAEEIFAAFGIGGSAAYSGVTVEFMAHLEGPGVPEDGWFNIVISITYRSFLTR